jgi:hypothetical protein
MEVSPVKRAMQRAFARPEQELQFTLREGQEFAP